ncbi:hypothetical protein L2E82_45419 [Cichorium intybus]|uniref:Uncharacterized protein n=1 Tax=Cichorium intybus TaxID=13427 RepID=A0ACB8ZTW7_CICIN|nr:hypothetical protein L2E82_45419 [Cichorium intybus]
MIQPITIACKVAGKLNKALVVTGRRNNVPHVVVVDAVPENESQEAKRLSEITKERGIAHKEAERNGPRKRGRRSSVVSIANLDQQRSATDEQKGSNACRCYRLVLGDGTAAGSGSDIDNNRCRQSSPKAPNQFTNSTLSSRLHPFCHSSVPNQFTSSAFSSVVLLLHEFAESARHQEGSTTDEGCFGWQ